MYETLKFEILSLITEGATEKALQFITPMKLQKNLFEENLYFLTLQKS
jgi:hypothetical protein